MRPALRRARWRPDVLAGSATVQQRLRFTHLPCAGLTEDQLQVMDPKVAKRILANRQVRS